MSRQIYYYFFHLLIYIFQLAILLVEIGVHGAIGLIALLNVMMELIRGCDYATILLPRNTVDPVLEITKKRLFVLLDDAIPVSGAQSVTNVQSFC